MTEPVVKPIETLDYRKLYLEEMDKRIKAEARLIQEGERLDRAVNDIKLKVINIIVDIEI